ncbi:hypothetical protein CC1G_14962 [Coprinopsis cinerea okayama7|uniref:Uncharacterized protein n=1 Tax=Coprinopsis cinerea (strain Okayama-7 / 130 / ATCC MYA-4618 / FGSC 9003) TaxID=240176 RepID=D6RP94_COPC7|nr:hypothetical protein CC1G_14962 [Coprinopsis cinerea okayama7\|eukprot:XP_002910631.1 hypothetical protein CC1G_14962 [Coprinopsis cinerea okayama7\
MRNPRRGGNAPRPLVQLAGHDQGGEKRVFSLVYLCTMILSGFYIVFRSLWRWRRWLEVGFGAHRGIMWIGSPYRSLNVSDAMWTRR